MRSAIVVNGTDAYQAACLAGLGMIQAPVHGTQHLVEAGRLVDVMPNFLAAPMPVSLLYPNRRQMAPRVQAILNWLSQVVQPWLESEAVDTTRKTQRSGHCYRYCIDEARCATHASMRTRTFADRLRCRSCSH
jgi:LysR substrate binding domain